MARASISRELLAERRHRARRRMRWLTAICVLVPLGLGLLALKVEGLNTFLDRPAGVGASTPAPTGPDPSP